MASVPLLLAAACAWALAAGVLVIVGFLLSHLTLESAKRIPKDTTGRALGFELVLRRLYRAVITFSCLFYWVSLPLVLLATLALAGGLVWACFAIGRIPIKLILVAIVMVFASLAAVFKAVVAVVRAPADEDPGLLIDLTVERRLSALMREVAERIGTRPVEKVFMVPGTDVAVFERGGMLAQLSGRSERCLILGAGVLPGMQIRWLKAILGHEYGHFQNADTAGGGFALAVRRSLITMAVTLAESGGATWINPAWLFFRAYFWIFLRVSQGASRLQEVLADRWAASAYGSQAFMDGFRHAIRRAVEFDAHVQSTLPEVIGSKRGLANLYTYRPEKPVEPAEIERAIAEALDRAASPFDSHPAPRDRLAWVERLAAQGSAASEDDQREAWTLFVNRAALEHALTAEVRKGVLSNHGVEIPAQEPPGRQSPAERPVR